MVDRLTPERRSWNMSRIRGRDTRPEQTVRDIVHRLRYRMDLYRPDLPGRPDIVLPRRRAVVFVHGCFWHRHRDCPFAYSPKSNRAFWRRKFIENIRRDRSVRRKLRRLGWRVVVVWECELRDHAELTHKLRASLAGEWSARRPRTPN